jgi:two-component system response regulator DctR
MAVVVRAVESTTPPSPSGLSDAMVEDSATASIVPLLDWRVMIIEDHATIASVHKRIIDSVPGLRTEHIARNGDEGFRAVRVVQPDLIILDLAMPGGDGLPFLRQLRREGIPIDVIVVTASRGGRVVQECTHLGVVDYLVKPFRPQRLRGALSAFVMRRRTLTRSTELSQAEVDTVQASGSGQLQGRLPKGLKHETLSAVISTLGSQSRTLCADEVGEQVGIARVTARRYLEYLHFMGAVDMTQQMDGPGRPRNRYRLKGMRHLSVSPGGRERYQNLE